MVRGFYGETNSQDVHLLCSEIFGGCKCHEGRTIGHRLSILIQVNTLKYNGMACPAWKVHERILATEPVLGKKALEAEKLRRGLISKPISRLRLQIKTLRLLKQREGNA